VSVSTAAFVHFCISALFQQLRLIVERKKCIKQKNKKQEEWKKCWRIKKGLGDKRRLDAKDLFALLTGKSATNFDKIKRKFRPKVQTGRGNGGGEPMKRPFLQLQIASTHTTTHTTTHTQTVSRSWRFSHTCEKFASCMKKKKLH